MPQKDDFLSRLQAQLNETLTRVHGLSAAGRLDDALVLLRTAQRNVVGLDALLKRLSSADLLGLLGSAGTPDLEKTLACAELLSAEFEVLLLRGEADPTQAHKALELYLAALDGEPGFAPHYSKRLDTLTQGLQTLRYALPPQTQHALAEVYRAAGRFDAAENWLYRWREAEPGNAQPWAEAFYRDLLSLPDEVLAAGGLPRDEVKEGLADVTGQVAR